MKNNFVAKHAQRSGAGFHSDPSKPRLDDNLITIKCLSCGNFSDIEDHELDCPECGSKAIVEIGGLS